MADFKKVVTNTYSVENLTEEEYKAIQNLLTQKVASNTATPTETALSAAFQGNI